MSRRSTRRRVGAVVSVVALAAGVAATAPGAARAAVVGYTTPNAVPSTLTPAVNDGQVNAITRVGSSVVLGGTFSSATSKGGSATGRSGLLAFNPATGRLTSFAPTLNGEVEAVLPGPVADTVYAAGSFTKVNGKSMSRLVLLDLSSGTVVSGWRSPGASSLVRTLALTGGRLLIGGDFTTVGGQPRPGLASLDPRTGAVTSFLQVALSVHHNNSGSGAQGPIGARSIAATPDGSKLVVVGNFKKADGLARDQVAILDLSGGSAAVNGWSTDGYSPACFYWAFDTYLRSVAVSPDGRYFVIAATGGPNPGTLCDSAARFEVADSGAGAQPTWVASTGGDTLWSVAITDQAVFVGGHQRWLNNPFGSDSAGPGAVPRPGLAALDPDTGLPEAWNPGRNPRGAAAFALYADRDGLWVGSDTDYIGNRTYTRKKIAYFPSAGGTTVGPDTARTLPGTVYVATPRTPSAAGSTLDTTRFDGTTAAPAAAADPRGIDWRAVKGAFMLGDDLYTAQSDGSLLRRTFTTSATGSPVDQDPYDDPYWDDVQTGSGGVYQGYRPTLLTNFGSKLTGLTRAGKRIFFTYAGDSRLYWSWFGSDSGAVGSQAFTADTGVDWRTTAGLFAAGGSLYAVDAASGALRSVALDGTRTTGGLSTVESTRDWRGSAIFLGPRTTANQAPAASFTVSCAEVTCTLDASASADRDGTVADYAWDFGDGTTGTGRTVSHEFTAAGTYAVTLRVTDNDGGTGTATNDAVVRGSTQAAITYVGSATTSVNSAQPALTVPADVQPGDLLALVGTYAVDGAAPATPDGWTRLSSTTSTGVTSYVWTRRASAGDAGSKVTTALAATTKAALGLTAYRGVSTATPVPAYASSKDTGTSHVSPTVTAGAGDWVLQAWTDKSTSTSAWTAPSGLGNRGSAVGTGSGRASILLADSDGPVGAGPAGGSTATTDASSTRAIMWTLVIRAQS